MACTTISAGRDFQCNDGLGGLVSIYVIPFTDVLSRITKDSDDIITAISAGSTIEVFKFDLREDGNSFEEASEQSRENGTSFVTQTLTVVLKRQDASSRKQLQLLSYGRPQVIIEDANGTFRLAGLEFGSDVTVNASSGGALSDMNGYNLTFEARERELSNFVSSSLINTGASDDEKFNVSNVKMN